MKPFDRLLQQWRIAVVRPYIPTGARLLDIGCGDGALFRELSPHLRAGVGIDLDPGPSRAEGAYQLIVGRIPEDLPNPSEPFDVITMLSVLEHVPPTDQPRVAKRCHALLKPGGYLVISVPSPTVDHLVRLLSALRIMDGTHCEEHYGFIVSTTPTIFQDLTFVQHKTFQCGLNHLFVFQKPGSPALQ